MTFDDTKTVITPEQVAVTYRLAGIGTRFAAVLVDTFLHVLIVAAVVLVLEGILPLVGDTISWLEWMASDWAVAAAIIAVFAVFWGYFIFWETLWSGRTPGKKLAHIRVIRDSGHPIDFRAAFVRNIMRYVDFLPGGYGVGAVTMFLSRDSKRLGDYAAGTIVVVDDPPVPQAEPDAAAPPEDFPLLGDPGLLNLHALTREQILVADRFLARQEDLPEAARDQLAREIALPLMRALGLEADSPDYPYHEFLRELTALYRRRDKGLSSL